ncbi:probable serine/threonine-protein kinase tsuA [Anopheles cruzii]|uniref:probable serine/threonine-protein kinase tsuA n=1 Tax=Anopheles cruzii TaxID=68878 RepID=UPI0022EC527E|nr:probable serine/threonine-protein kinase tsuA [Anopheles cruzii]
MHMLDLVTDIAMASSSGMEISEPFRTEDLSKTDFFDFVTGSAPDMAISSSSGGSASGGNANSNRVMSGVGLGGTVTDRPPGGGGRNGNADGTLDGSPANRSATSTAGNPTGDANDQPLQGFDQFWGSDKDANRLDPAMFEDLNRYCWIQQNNNNNNNSSAANNNSTNNNNNGALNHQVADTDGQIYTLTVLNGAPEPWVLRKDPTTSSEPAAPASNLDLDTILGGFPGYVKTECFSYDDSGFGTDHHAKEDPHQQQQQHQQHLLVQQQHQHLQQQVQPQQQQQQQQQMPVTSSNIVLSSNLLDPNSVLAYQNNNNNDWQMSDHNVIQQETPESLLRSALQGKGYTKGMQQLQNGATVGGGAVTVLPSPGHMKDDELRRVLYATHGDPTDSLSAYADSTLTSSIYDESVLHSPASTNQSVQQHHQQQQQLAGDLGGGPGGPGSGPGSVVVDDMFLTLDAAFTEDYEKLKRIATEVQQFCTDNNNYAEIIVETGSSIVGNNGLSTAAAANNHNLGHGNGAPSLLNSSSSSTVANSNNHHPLILSSPSTPTAAPAAGLQQRQPTVSTTTCSDVVTTTSTTKAKTPRAKKSYKRSLSTSNSAGGATGTGAQNPSSSAILATGNTNLTCLATPQHSNHNNNNNNTNMSNLNTMLSPNGGAAGGTGSGNTTTSTTTTTSPTQCGNGQRKERSLHYCSICSKGFKDKYSVNVHIRTHTGEKPFACSLCGKSFRQKAHLAKHYQTHLAQKNPAAGTGAGVGTVSKQSKQSRLAAPPPPLLADPSGVPPVPPPPPPPPPGLLATSVGPPPIGVDSRLDMSPPLLLNTPAASSAANNTAPPIVASR